MYSIRPVRTKRHGLFYICCSGRTRDKVYRSWHHSIFFAQHAPGFFHAFYDARDAHHRDVRFRQKAGRWRSIFSGKLHQCPGFRNRAECAGNAYQIVSVSWPRLNIHALRNPVELRKFRPAHSLQR